MDEKTIWFDQQIGIENSGVINGDEYQPLARSLSSHPFFFGTETKGSVEYRGQRFLNIPLMYDVVQQQLLLRYLDETGIARFIELEQSDVKSFRLSENAFRNIEGKGYYEVLLDSSHVSLFAKREKIRNLRSGLVQYDLHQNYFVVLNGEWKALRNNRDAKEIFDDESKQQAIAEFLRNKKIKVSRFHDDQLVNLVRFCIELCNERKTR